jgi:hypothetical protein
MQDMYGKWFASKPVNAGKILMADQIVMLRGLKGMLEEQLLRDLETEAALVDMQSRRAKGDTHGREQ